MCRHRLSIDQVMPSIMSKKNFYAEHVHQERIDNYSRYLPAYQKRVAKELGFFGWSLRDLKGKKIIDFGSGLQSVVFAQAGADRVFHFDISDRQVERLRDYTRRQGVKNIETKVSDLDEDVLDFPAFDFSFMLGVFHHLARPENSLLALLSSCNADGSLYFRVYRAGTWSRWLVEQLRTLSALTSINHIKEAYLRDRGNVILGTFLEDMVDDLFTEILSAYHLSDFQRVADRLDLGFHSPDVETPTGFSALDENFRFLFHKRSENNDYSAISVSPSAYSEVPRSIDLARSIKIEIDDLKNAMATRDSKLNALTLVDLYRLVRSEKGYPDLFRANMVPQVDVSVSEATLGDARVRSLMYLLKFWKSL